MIKHCNNWQIDSFFESHAWLMYIESPTYLPCRMSLLMLLNFSDCTRTSNVKLINCCTLYFPALRNNVEPQEQQKTPQDWLNSERKQRILNIQGVEILEHYVNHNKIIRLLKERTEAKM